MYAMQHNIRGSEVYHCARMIPGYAAIYLNAPRRRRLGWGHALFVFGVMVIGLTTAGTQGLLP
jgi:hypothetical protein